MRCDACSETKALARAGLRNPATVSVAVRSKAAGGAEAPGQKTQATPSSLENFYIVCGPEEKLAQLVGFLKVLIIYRICDHDAFAWASWRWRTYDDDALGMGMRASLYPGFGFLVDRSMFCLCSA